MLSKVIKITQACPAHRELKLKKGVVNDIPPKLDIVFTTDNNNHYFFKPPNRFGGF